MVYKCILAWFWSKLHFDSITWIEILSLGIFFLSLEPRRVLHKMLHINYLVYLHGDVENICLLKQYSLPLVHLSLMQGNPVRLLSVILSVNCGTLRWLVKVKNSDFKCSGILWDGDQQGGKKRKQESIFHQGKWFWAGQMVPRWGTRIHQPFSPYSQRNILFR